MKKSILILLTFLVANFAFCEEKIVTITTSDSIKLEGSLLVPTKGKGNAVVLFICGSGPTDRNGNNRMMQNNSIKYLAEALDSAGIATLRYDKRGIGKSTNGALNESKVRFSTFVNDADAWVKYLSESYKRVILIGHSEGALIATLESLKDSKVKGTVLIAGMGHSMDEVLKKQLSAQSPILKDMAFPIIDSLKCGKAVNNIPPVLNPIFRESIQPFLMEVFSIDPAKEIAKLREPILIIQGDTDIQVSVDDADLLATAQPKAQKHIIHNMNHILKYCSSTDRMINISTYNNPSLPNMNEVAPLIVDFIKAIK